MRLGKKDLVTSFVVLGALCGGAVAEESCWAAAARMHHVNPNLLYAIAKQESGMNPLARGVNANGTYDIGLMQINSAHLPLLSRHGIQEQHLYDPCVSIHVGAWLLSQNMRRLGNSWVAIGSYNAVSHEKRVNYAWKIFRQLERMQSVSPSASNVPAR